MLTGAAEPEAQLDIPDAHLSDRRHQARRSRARWPATVEGGRWSVPAPPVEVVDTSGAGDAFLGGFLGAYLRGEGIEAALKRGVALGSQSVTTLGARP